MQQYGIKANFKPKKFNWRTFFVNLWKGLSWFLLTGTGIFICCMPWLAASFGLVLPTIFAGVAFPAMLTLGLIIAIPSFTMMIASILHICCQDGWAKLIKNIALSTMALAALVIGILLLAAPGLPIISAFAGMIGGLGSFGAFLTKISLIALGVFQGFDVGWDFWKGSKLRALYGAIGNDVDEQSQYAENAIFRALDCVFYNLPKVIRNLAIIALGIIICCKISLAVGLVFAIPFGLKLVANLSDRNGKIRGHRVSKSLNNLVRLVFSAALIYAGISFLQPAVLLGFLGELSFVATALSGPVALAAGISLIVFGALMLFKTVTDVICGDKEKLKQGACEIATSVSEGVQGSLAKKLDCLDVENQGKEINNIVPGLVGDVGDVETDGIFK